MAQEEDKNDPEDRPPTSPTKAGPQLLTIVFVTFDRKPQIAYFSL
jgi:hypothetical protein